MDRAWEEACMMRVPENKRPQLIFQGIDCMSCVWPKVMPGLTLVWSKLNSITMKSGVSDGIEGEKCNKKGKYFVNKGYMEDESGSFAIFICFCVHRL